MQLLRTLIEQALILNDDHPSSFELRSISPTDRNQCGACGSLFHFSTLTLPFDHPAFSRIENTSSTRSFGASGAISRFTEVISDGLESL